MDKFINPYTFVPVETGEKKSISEYYSNEKLLSGKIECTLKTLTQMSVCEQVSEKNFDFFSVDGKPVIPGSTIRGVIRNVYETLTDSCFSSTNADDDDYFSSRLDKKECGLLSFENGEYILYKAERYKDKQNLLLENYHEGQKVKFDSYKSTSGQISYLRNVEGKNAKCTGYVHKVDRFKGKINGKPIENLDSIFEKIGIVRRFPQKESNGREENRYIKRLEENIRMYEASNSSRKSESEKKEDEKRHREYEALFMKMKKGEAMLPVWYLESDGHFYFSSSQMSRAVFYNQPIDILEKHNLDKCSGKENICEACAVFGMTGENNCCISSRLRFSDAECRSDDCLEKDYVTVLMGTPRLSSFEFYLRYKGEKFTADIEGVNISGRKFYWHDNSGKKLQSAEKVQENMERKIQLLKKDTVFRFNVYFDDITEEQLKKIIFALNLGDNSIDSKQCHKIGYGKPIGLGSAKIICNNVTVRSFEYPHYEEKDRSDLIAQATESLFSNQNNVKCLLRVTDFNAVEGGLISYPYYDDKEKIFEWFSKNRWKVPKNKSSHCKLPSLMSKKQDLPCHPETESNGNSHNYNSGKNKPYTGKTQFGDSSTGGFFSNISTKGKRK